MVTRNCGYLFRGGDGPMKGQIKSAVTAATGDAKSLSAMRAGMEGLCRKLNPPTLRPGAREFVSSLLHNNIPVIILSNGDSKYIHKEVYDMLGDAIASRLTVTGKQPGKP